MVLNQFYHVWFYITCQSYFMEAFSHICSGATAFNGIKDAGSGMSAKTICEYIINIYPILSHFFNLFICQFCCRSRHHKGYTVISF